MSWKDKPDGVGFYHIRIKGRNRVDIIKVWKYEHGNKLYTSWDGGAPIDDEIFDDYEWERVVIRPDEEQEHIANIDDCKGEITSPVHKMALGQVVAKFKYWTTRRVNLLRQTSGAKLWQRNYYVNVIDSKEDLNKIRDYISDNPVRWNLDRENPINWK